jgi:hypothetical protein
MINLDREALTNLLAANRNSFSEFPVVESFCSSLDVPTESLGEHYSILVKEISSMPKLKRAIEECVRAPFEIDSSNYDIANGAELYALIRKHSIVISEGEETWIGNLEKIHSSLQGGACCSARAALSAEADACYLDLITQCDSSWIFVKNIKNFVNAETLTFRIQDGTSKMV